MSFGELPTCKSYRLLASSRLFLKYALNFSLLFSVVSKSNTVFSQAEENSQKINSQNTEGLERSRRLGLIGGYETITASLRIEESENELEYESSSLRRFNLGVEWNGYAGSVSVSSNSRAGIEEGEVSTGGFALILQGAKGPIGWVGSYYNIRGFNLRSINGKRPNPDQRGRDDIRLINVGLNLFYSFFHEDFSPAAAFRHLEKQSFSGWSPLVEVSYDTFAISASKSLVPDDKVDLFQNSSDFTGSMSTSLNVYLGVAGIWAITQNMFVAGSLSVGIGPELSRTSSSDGEVTATSQTTKSSARFSLGYKTGDNAFGLNSFNDNIQSSHEGYDTVFSKFSSEIYYAHLTDWFF